MKQLFGGKKGSGASMVWGALIVLVVAGVLGACGNDVGRQASGRIQVSPATVGFGVVQIGESATEPLKISNHGESELEIFDLKFKPKKNSTIEALSVKGGLPGSMSIAPGESKTLTFKFEPKKAGRPNAGTLVLDNSDPSYANEPLTVPVTTLGNKPQISVDPNPVRFPRLPPGEQMTRTVTIRNLGNAPLTLYEAPTMSGNSDFQVVPGSLDGKFKDGQTVTLAPFGQGSESEASNRLELEVRYKPSEDGTDSGELLLKSNEDPTSSKGSPTETRVPVNANADSACLLIDRTARNLGAVPIGGSITEAVTVESCGNKPLKITSLAIGKNSSDNEFSLNLAQHDEDGDGTLDEPVVLENPGETANFAVTYEPENAGTDEATVVITSNDPVRSQAEVELLATGSEGQCPTAKVTAKVEGNETFVTPPITVAPLDTVVLDASGSQDPDGRIEGYEWKVLSTPEDTTARLQETASGEASQRQFRALTAGTYEIGMRTRDNDGFWSCEQAIAKITAIPNEDIHIELTWTNPKDDNLQDDRGADVDLHLVKMGPGTWFDRKWDIFFQNKNNDSNDTPGAGIWEPEDPSLDIDDQNGAGPENIQMDNPVDCQWYAVGVHYWEQFYGTAYATVRIYINEKLAFEKLNVPLREGGVFWDVARIHWPTGRVFGVGTKRPEAPRGEEPAVPESMSSSGLCTNQQLY